MAGLHRASRRLPGRCAQPGDHGAAVHLAGHVQSPAPPGAAGSGAQPDRDQPVGAGAGLRLAQKYPRPAAKWPAATSTIMRAVLYPPIQEANMTSVSSSTTIYQPVEKVFNFLTQVENQKNMQPGIL